MIVPYPCDEENVLKKTHFFGILSHEQSYSKQKKKDSFLIQTS